MDDGARLRGRVRARAPTRCGSGCRCARCSCCRSRGRRCGCCTSTSRCCSAFSVSYAFFNAAQIGVSVPLVYPLLALPARAHARGRGRARARPRAAAAAADRARPCLGIAAVFILGVRVGAQRRRLERDRRRLRERDRCRPRRRRRGRCTATSRSTTRTATPTARSSTSRTCRSRRCCRGAGAGTTCPPAHAAALVFDLLTAAGLWLLGRRLRGPGARDRCSPTRGRPSRSRCSCRTPTPTTALVALLVARRDAGARAARRCAAPSIARGGADEVRPARAGAAVRDLRDARGRARRWRVTAAGFAAVAALALAPVALGDGLGTFWDRTLGFQSDRGSPFSVWGLYDLPGRSRRARRRARPRGGRRLRPAPPRPGQRRRARRRGADRAPARAGRTGSTSTSSGSCRSCWSRCSPGAGSARSTPRRRRAGSSVRISDRR